MLNTYLQQSLAITAMSSHIATLQYCHFRKIATVSQFRLVPRGCYLLNFWMMRNQLYVKIYSPFNSYMTDIHLIAMASKLGRFGNVGLLFNPQYLCWFFTKSNSQRNFWNPHDELISTSIPSSKFRGATALQNKV